MSSGTRAKWLAGAVLSVSMFSTAAFAAETTILPALQRAAVDTRNIKVAEAEGIIILRGKVRSSADRERASNVLRELGHTRVANLLQIESRPDDEAIKRSAERALSFSRSMDGCRFTVEARNGVVRIEGFVTNDLQKDAAREIVERIEGVERVVTDLKKTS